MKYEVVAKVEQIVTKEIHLLVNAGSEEEAEAKTQEALAVYPSKISVEGFENILTVKQKCWPPKSINTQVKEVKSNG